MGIAPESWPAPFRTAIRTSNKYLLNPLMMRLAGKRLVRPGDRAHRAPFRTALRDAHRR